MGTAAEMMITSYGALIVGFFCGIFSTLGFAYLSVRTLRARAGDGVMSLVVRRDRGRGEA